MLTLNDLQQPAMNETITELDISTFSKTFKNKANISQRYEEHIVLVQGLSKI